MKKPKWKRGSGLPVKWYTELGRKRFVREDTVFGDVYGDCLHIFLHTEYADETEEICTLSEFHLTHTRSGYRIAAFAKKSGAVKMAEYLWSKRKIREVLELTSPYEVRRKMPKDVIRWIKKCDEKKKFIPR